MKSPADVAAHAQRLAREMLAWKAIELRVRQEVVGTFQPHGQTHEPVRDAPLQPVFRLEALVRNIRDILSEAIAAGGSTLQDFAATDGQSGSFQQRFAVYDREGEPCPSWGAALKRRVQAGRSTFYCKTCQR